MLCFEKEEDVTILCNIYSWPGYPGSDHEL